MHIANLLLLLDILIAMLDSLYIASPYSNHSISKHDLVVVKHLLLIKKKIK